MGNNSSKEKEVVFSGNESSFYVVTDDNFYITLNYTVTACQNRQGGGSEQEHNKTYFKNNLGSDSMKELQRYKEYLCGEYTNETTIKNNYNAVKRFCEYVRGDFSKETVLKWRIYINTKAHNTINVSISAVNQFLFWMRLIEKEKPWMKTIGQQDTDKITLTEQEIKTLINKSENNLETHLIVLLLFHALRPKDIINLKISDLKGDTLYLKKTKTGNNHTILTKTIINAWNKYLEIRPKPKQEYEDYLLICSHSDWKGNPYVTTLPIQKKIKRLAKENGIEKDVTPYTIRRTSATLRLSNNSEFYLGNPKNVQRLFRHKNIETTFRYDHTTDDDLRRSLQETEKDLIETGKDLTENRKVLTKVKRTYSLNNYVFPTETNENLDDENSFSFSFSFFFFDDYQKLPNNRELDDLLTRVLRASFEEGMGETSPPSPDGEGDPKGRDGGHNG